MNMKEITIQLTEQCNLSCPYCFAPKQCATEISDQNFSRFIEFCRDNRIESIHVTGGEPTLHTHALKYIRCLAETAYVVVYTNFTVSRFIERLDIRESDMIFLININMPTLYSTAQWDALLANIEAAQSKKVRLAFGHTFHTQNIEYEFEYVTSLAKSHNIKLLRLSPAVSPRLAADDIEHERSNVKKLYKLVESHYDELICDGVKCYFDCPVSACWIDHKTYEFLKERGAVASPCRPKVFVSYNMSLHHCYVAMDKVNAKSLWEFPTWEDARAHITECVKSQRAQNCTNLQICPACSVSNSEFGCGCPMCTVHPATTPWTCKWEDCDQ